MSNKELFIYSLIAGAIIGTFGTVIYKVLTM